MPWILLSESVLLLIETPGEQWFSRNLVPYKHYVPIKPDFSDLIKQIEWLRNNDKKAMEIGKEGAKFARFHF